jgi:DNA-binding transcriptional MerR regulator
MRRMASDLAMETTTETATELTIAQIATHFGVTHRTVRFYEDLGLLTPERRGTRRIFHHGDQVRLGLILRGKRLGFSLEEITRIIRMYDDQPGEAGQLRYLLGQIAERRADLEQRRQDVLAALTELDELELRCRADLSRLA